MAIFAILVESPGRSLTTTLVKIENEGCLSSFLSSANWTIVLTLVRNSILSGFPNLTFGSSSAKKIRFFFQESLTTVHKKLPNNHLSEAFFSLYYFLSYAVMKCCERRLISLGQMGVVSKSFQSQASNFDRLGLSVFWSVGNP